MKIIENKHEFIKDEWPYLYYGDDDACVSDMITAMECVEEKAVEKLNEAKEMLENVLYWETCPKEYKERIIKLFPDIDYKKEE